MTDTTGSTDTLSVTISWIPIKPLPDLKYGVPCTRSSHGISLVNNGSSIIIYGGEHVARTPIDNDDVFWSCDKKKKNSSSSSDEDDEWQWRRIVCDVLPPARVAHSQAVYKDTSVYVFGGRAGITMEEKPMNDLWLFDAVSEKWTHVEAKSGEPPSPRSFHRMVCCSDALYVFGGCGANGRLNDLYKFDIKTSSWSNLGSSKILRGRGGANLITLNNGKSLGIVAGFAGEETNDGHGYDIDGETWYCSGLKLTGLRPRSVCVATNSYPSLSVSIIFGGEVDPSEKGHEGAGGFTNDIVILDGTFGDYKTTISCPPAEESSSSWPECRGWSDGDSYDDGKGTGILYVFGGLSGDDTNPKRLNDLWQCTIKKSS